MVYVCNQPRYLDVTSLVSVWNQTGICMEPDWYLYVTSPGISISPAWYVDVTSLVSVLNQTGICMEPDWYLYGTILVSVCNQPGISM